MTRFFAAPSLEEVRETLQLKLPALVGRDVAPLGEGWDFVTFAVGDKVVRMPKVDAVWTVAGETPLAQRLQAEAALLAELAPTLPLPIPVPVVIEDGPNGLPFTFYDLIPGVPLGELQRPGADNFGDVYAGFIKAMQAFPVARLRDLGFVELDGTSTRQHTIEWYEMLVRRAFPLLSCEARTFTVLRFETYLNQPRNLAFEPRLTHRDLDQRNVLADPDSGELTGVIDFGDAFAGDPVFDLGWAVMGGFEAIGIANQLPSFLDAMDATIESVQPQCEFYNFCWPLHEIIHGLDRNDPDEVQAGIRYLNSMVPANIRC